MPISVKEVLRWTPMPEPRVVVVCAGAIGVCGLGSSLVGFIVFGSGTLLTQEQ
jgi:hypothetical protein